MGNLTMWEDHRDSLKRQIELMRSGKMKTFEGSSLSNDTTALSLQTAEASLLSVERHIERESRQT